MGRKAALISGGITLAVVFAGLFWSREFVVRYQVYRMSRDVDYLLRFIESGEGTIAGEAVRRICGSGEFPGTGLLRAYVEGLGGLLDSLGYDQDDVRFSIASNGR